MCIAGKRAMAGLSAAVYVLVILGVGDCLACSCGSAGYEGAWDRTNSTYSDSNLYVANIIKKWSVQWFHYKTETCPLKVPDVHDYDFQYLNTGIRQFCYVHYQYTDIWAWHLVETDYHDHNRCDWTGIGVTEENGHECVWDMRQVGPTSIDGVTVTFWGLKGSTTTAKARVYGEAEANWDGYKTEAYVQTTGSMEYTCGSPTYDTEPMPLNPGW